MAIVNYCGFEVLSSTILEMVGISGTVSNVTSPVRTGGGAFRSNPTTTGQGFAGLYAIGSTGISVTASVATSYIQFWFRYATKPASNSEEIFEVVDTAGGYKLAIRINSTGTLGLYQSGGTTLIANGSTVLSQDTWYRIDVKCGTGTTADYELKINNTTELSGTANLGTSNAGSWYVGKTANRNSNTVDFYYDDLVVSDSGYITGDVQIKRLTPDSNGSTMTWSLGTGASDYTQVDDNPVSDADYVMSPTTGNPNTALFGLTSTSTEGISGTILALKGYVRTRENTTVTSAHRIRIRSGSTNSDSSNRNGTTTNTAQQRILENDPDTGSAWTLSSLDSVEVGVVEDNAVSTRCSIVNGLVLFVASGQPIIKRRAEIPFLGGSLRTANF